MTEPEITRMLNECYVAKRDRKEPTEIMFDLTSFPSAEAAARTIGTLCGQGQDWIDARIQEWRDLNFQPPTDGIKAMLANCPPVTP